MGTLKNKISKYGILGGVLVSVGGIGAFGVCHTICQAIIVGLAAVGIGIIGMPLAFLQEPWFIALSFGIGGLFLVSAPLAYKKHKRMQVIYHESCQPKREGGEKNEIK